MALDRTKITRNADKYVRQGKFEQAIEELKRLVGENPRDVNTKNRIGDLYVRAGRVDDAVRTYQEIGAHYADEGFYLKAIAVYKKISRTDPSVEDVYFKLADLYLKQGLKDDAKKQFLDVADIYAKAGNHERMREALDRIVAIDPENVKVRVRLAEAYQRANMTEQAIEAYCAVGQELSRRDQLDDAGTAFERAQALQEGHPSVVAGWCQLLLRRGEYAQVIDRAKAAYSENRDNTGMLEAVVEAALKTGRADLAQQFAERLTEIDPESEQYRELLQRTQASAGGAAAPAVEEPSAELPDLSDISGVDYSMEELEEVSGEWLGAAAEVAGDALEAPEQVSSEKEEFIAEHTTEAEVFIKYGLVEKAVEHLEAILSQYPDEVETLVRLKDLYRESGNAERAAQTLVGLARVHRKAGDSEQAEEAMREAESLDPASLAAAGAGEGYEAESARSESADVSADEFYGFGQPPEESSAEVEAVGVELEFDAEEPAEQESPEQAEAGGFEFGGQATGGQDFFGTGGDEPKAEAGEEDGFEISLEPEEGGDAIDIDLEHGEQEAEQAGPGDEPAAGGAVELTLESSPSEELDQAAAGQAGFGDEAAPFGAAEETPFGTSEDNEVFDEESDFFHVAELDQPGTQPEAAQAGQGEENLEEILQEFKKGVDEQLGEEDFETHYQLGIAYKEMGLVDEAISEFQTAAKSEDLFVDSCSNLGVCFREKGMPKLALKWYERALGKVSEDSEQYLAIVYDLGETYEECEDPEKALQMYMNVYGLNANYRDIGDKVKRLGES